MAGKYTEAQKKATSKYLKESVDEIKIRLPKGKKEEIKEAADLVGESVNTYIQLAINMRISSEKKENTN